MTYEQWLRTARRETNLRDHFDDDTFEPGESGFVFADDSWIVERSDDCFWTIVDRSEYTGDTLESVAVTLWNDNSRHSYGAEPWPRDFTRLRVRGFAKAIIKTSQRELSRFDQHRKEGGDLASWAEWSGLPMIIALIKAREAQYCIRLIDQSSIDAVRRFALNYACQPVINSSPCIREGAQRDFWANVLSLIVRGEDE